jgi:hypothetical protein
MPSFSVGESMEALEEGIYAARIQSIESVIVDPNRPPSKYGDKPQLVVTYAILDVPKNDDGSYFTRRQYANEVATLTPKSTLYGLFSQILEDGGPLDKERQYSTDELINKPCQIFWGTYVGDDGTSKMKILKVSPPKKQAAAAGVRRRAVEEPDAEVAAEIDNI